MIDPRVVLQELEKTRLIISFEQAYTSQGQAWLGLGGTRTLNQCLKRALLYH